MTQQDMVQTVFAKLGQKFADNGLHLADDVGKDGEVTTSAHEKREAIAKLLGLVKGVRKVGGLKPTDNGLLFIGVDPAELQAAKDRADAEAEIAQLEAEIAERKAKLNVK